MEHRQKYDGILLFCMLLCWHVWKKLHNNGVLGFVCVTLWACYASVVNSEFRLGFYHKIFALEPLHKWETPYTSERLRYNQLTIILPFIQNRFTRQLRIVLKTHISVYRFIEDMWKMDIKIRSASGNTVAPSYLWGFSFWNCHGYRNLQVLSTGSDIFTPYKGLP